MIDLQTMENEWQDQKRRIEQLEAERDELKADAVRYRWLRTNSRNDFLYDTANAMATLIRSDKLDAAIAKGEK